MRNRTGRHLPYKNQLLGCASENESHATEPGATPGRHPSRLQRYTATMATSAGYSGTPLFKKLGYRDGMTVVAIGMPPEVQELIESGARA